MPTTTHHFSFLCCIDPDPAALYQRHIDEPASVQFDTLGNQCRSGGYGSGGQGSGNSNNNQAGGGMGFQPRDPHQPDYSLEWAQIYVAANNLFSSVSFSLFCFVIVFEIV